MARDLRHRRSLRRRDSAGKNGPGNDNSAKGNSAKESPTQDGIGSDLAGRDIADSDGVCNGVVGSGSTPPGGAGNGYRDNRSCEKDLRSSREPFGASGQRGRRPSAEEERKDRILQTRVPKELESTLKDAAERKRMTVSHLIRNVLEDTFKLVDGIVADSSALVEHVTRDARRLAASARGDNPRNAPAADQPPRPAVAGDIPPLAAESPPVCENLLDVVDAWQDVIVNRPGQCVACGVALARGKRAFRGISSTPSANAIWLCPHCIEQL